MIFKNLLQIESEELPLATMPVKIKTALIGIGIYMFLDLIKTILHDLITVENQGWKPLGFVFFSILFIGFFAYKIMRRKNWAKITMLVLFVLKLMGLPWVILGEFVFKSAIGIISLIQLPIAITVLVFLFHKESDPWFKGPEKTQEPVKEPSSPKQVIKTYWFWLIIPLSVLGYALGCELDTGGNVFAGIIMIFRPFILGLGLMVLLIFFLVGLKNKNQALLQVSKIGLLLISFPASYAAGVIFCH